MTVYDHLICDGCKAAIAQDKRRRAREAASRFAAANLNRVPPERKKAYNQRYYQRNLDARRSRARRDYHLKRAANEAALAEEATEEGDEAKANRHKEREAHHIRRADAEADAAADAEADATEADSAADASDEHKGSD